MVIPRAGPVVPRCKTHTWKLYNTCVEAARERERERERKREREREREREGKRERQRVCMIGQRVQYSEKKYSLISGNFEGLTKI